MGIYDNWNEVIKIAKERAGTASAKLPPPAPWWTAIPTYLNAIKVFVEAFVFLILLMINFYLWLDVISLWLK